MCFLRGTKWLLSQNLEFFIVAAVKTSNLFILLLFIIIIIIIIIIIDHRYKAHIAGSSVLMTEGDSPLAH
jgi:hypothetical protein